MHTDANSVAMCSSCIIYRPYAGTTKAEPVSRNISAVPELGVKGGGGYHEISVPWPVFLCSLLCELTGSDGPEFKVVNQYL